MNKAKSLNNPNLLILKNILLKNLMVFLFHANLLIYTQFIVLITSFSIFLLDCSTVLQIDLSIHLINRIIHIYQLLI